MREIKFRAWNGKYMDSFPIGKMFGWPDRRKAARGADGYVLMQYTGLKDKNGKEIYEGDVLEEKYGDDADRYAVGFIDGAFVSLPDDTGFEEFQLSGLVEAYGAEVIGNIWENPELLA